MLSLWILKELRIVCGAKECVVIGVETLAAEKEGWPPKNVPLPHRRRSKRR